MKLRVLGNRIRLRLTKGEVGRLCDGHLVSEVTQFPGGSKLSYQISATHGIQEMEANFEQTLLSIHVPNKLLKGWFEDDRVGLYHSLTFGNEKLDIAIEKDFQCLHKRPGEDESDGYPNPQSQ